MACALQLNGSTVDPPPSWSTSAGLNLTTNTAVLNIRTRSPEPQAIACSSYSISLARSASSNSKTMGSQPPASAWELTRTSRRTAGFKGWLGLALSVKEFRSSTPESTTTSTCSPGVRSIWVTWIGAPASARAGKVFYTTSKFAIMPESSCSSLWQ